MVVRMGASSEDWLAQSPYPSDLRSELFGGKETVEVWNLLAGRSFPPFSAALACELAPGGSVGPHQQQRDPELVLCAQGEGEIAVNGGARPFTPGEMALLPFGCTLAIRNASSDEPLRYFIIKARRPES
jgi:quercetin dioxygenase-like cupin family protein